jgi:hypothetical protein
LLLAHLRRRRAVAVYRAEQTRQEILEDAASWLIAATPFAANDDAGLVILPHDDASTWSVSSVTERSRP